MPQVWCGRRLLDIIGVGLDRAIFASASAGGVSFAGARGASFSCISRQHEPAVHVQGTASSLQATSCETHPVVITSLFGH